MIPGGNQLLSKRSEMFLPDQWPSYYKKACGVEIWDLDDQHYFDMSLMGVGTCVFGYAEKNVTQAVLQAIEDGSMSTLNCPEEVELAEKLIHLHPWAGMARFARTGGEACAIAVRIARAFTGKSRVAFCGYHGWHDWYLAANCQERDSLKEHLLGGLEPLGVPPELKGTALPFLSGDKQGFQSLMEEKGEEIGAIILEFARHKKVDLEFLNLVRAAADRIGAVVVLDEVTSGFRYRAGGMHVLYDFVPDIVVLGKAMGNGFPISAIVGKSSVMQAAQGSFISSTYWTERIGFVAALAVVKAFETQPVADQLLHQGEVLREQLAMVSQETGIDIAVVGLTPIPIIVFKEKDPLLVKSVFTQERLKRGLLAGNVVYLSLAHTQAILEEYVQSVREVFRDIRQALDEGRLAAMLAGPVWHGGGKKGG